VIGEWFDLSDSELRARLLQRGVPEAECRELITARETHDGIERIDQLLN
jgi:hypothetical protein